MNQTGNRTPFPGPLRRRVRRIRPALPLIVAAAIALGGPALQADPAQSESQQRPFTTSFRMLDCTFQSNSGANPHFSLEPGHRLMLEGAEGDETIDLQITVLDETLDINVPGLGTVTTRVVEERERVDGDLAEVSRNFFAICGETADVFYFGEDVDIYEDGVIVSHDGAWRAGVNGARPGLIMPGSFLLGARYFQEVAPGIALDRGENQGHALTVHVPAGVFADCVSVFETSALHASDRSFKVYSPGVGLIIDDALSLIAWMP